MKNSLAVIITALAASLFAEAAYISGTGLECEGNKIGPVDFASALENGMRMWGVPQGAGDIAKIASYGNGPRPGAIPLPDDDAEGSVMAQYCRQHAYQTDNENTRFLEINSGDTPVARSIHPGDAPHTIGEAGIYADAMVQFTASDMPPEIMPGDKLLVWLSASLENPAVTNLMITAGKHELVPVGSGVVAEAYSICTNAVDAARFKIAEGQWHRLTIVAEMHNYGYQSFYRTAHFKVYIDDEEIEAADISDGTRRNVFLSIARDSATISQLSFSGQGAVDDIVFATGTTHPIEEIAYAVIPDEGIEAFGYVIYDDDGVTVLDDGTMTGEFIISDVGFLGKKLSITSITYKGGYAEDRSLVKAQTISIFGECMVTSRPLAFTLVADSVPEATRYSYLADVVAALQGATSAKLTLESDYEITTERLEIECSLTVDLKGHCLSSANRNSNIFTVLQDSGSLTLLDTCGGGVLKFADGLATQKFLVWNQNNAHLTIGIEGDAAVGDFTLANGRINNSPALGSIPPGLLKIYGGKFSALPVTQGSEEIRDFFGICPDGYALGRDDGEEFYTLKPTVPDIDTTAPDIDTVARTAFATREAATAAASALIPPANARLSGDEMAAWKRHVAAGAHEREGAWRVEFALVDDDANALRNQAESGARAIVGALCAEGDEVAVPAIPGLYYSIESGADSPANLTEGRRTLAEGGNSTVTLTIEKPAGKGFYRLRISPISD